MSRPSAARQKLADFQQQLAALSNAQTKSQEQLDQVRSQLQNPNTEIKPLLAEQERLTQQLRLGTAEIELVQGRIDHFQGQVDSEEQERLRKERMELVAKAENDIIKWTERFEQLSNLMTEELRACHKELKPGIAAGLALQEDERSKRFLMGFGELSVPKIRPGDGHWLKHSLTMQHVDLDPEATQRGIAARQAEQDRRNAIEEARQQRVNQQEQDRRNVIAQAQQQRVNKLPTS